MMFVCCHPVVAEEGQVALILKTLCGFSVAEIAKAFLTNEETIAKRLYRAREQFRQQNIRFEFPQPGDLPQRRESVLTAIYLLFNEGYNSSNYDMLIREDLVEESLRLAYLLSNHPVTRSPNTFALLALLCSGGPALRPYRPPESSFDTPASGPFNMEPGINWTRSLFLQQASQGDSVSPYHMKRGLPMSIA